MGKHSSVCVRGGGSSSPALSVLFTPPLYHGPIFVQERASPPTGLRVTHTWILEMRAREGMWIPGQILSLPHFLEAQGKGFQELPAVFNSQPAARLGRLGAETPRRCPELHIPSLLSQDPGCGVGVMVEDFKSSFCCDLGDDMPEKPSSEFPGSSTLFLSN